MHYSVDEIYDLLTWDNQLSHEENEAKAQKGIDAAKQIKNLFPFIQPILVPPENSKLAWDSCAKVVAMRDDADLMPFIFLLLEWVQDLNWPGAITIYDRITRIPYSFIEFAFQQTRTKAEQIHDSYWLAVLDNLHKDMLDKQNINSQNFFDEQAKREATYIQMPTEELAKLSDDELFHAIWVRTENIVSSKEDLLEGFNSLSEEQCIFYAISYLEMEVNNGGLCQFFVNSSRVVAPIVSDYMEIIGATEHKKLYDAFIEKHQINLYDLSSFDSETVEAFQFQYERYPFNEYDDEFCKLEPLQSHLIPFLKKHIEKF